MKKVTTYLQGVLSELKKVTFPKRQEALEMTTLVIALSGAIAIYVTVADLGFRSFIGWLIGGY
jgi:preprotein translocase SecE subunit